MNALITSWQDYCNSLLYSTMDKNFVRLQRVQNAAAGFIVRVPNAQCPMPNAQCPSMPALLWYSHMSGMSIHGRAKINY